jgi:hypothetical protein
MQWCESMSDLLLLSAYEHACGRTTTLLWDLAVFETVVTEDLGQGGSISLRLRYLQVCMS